MTKKRPWHLRAVGVTALLWHSIGSVDFIMTHTHNADYLKNFSASQLSYFYALPAWFVVAWAIAIGFSVLASTLLLLAKKSSAPIFLISLIALTITNIYSYGIANGYAVMGGKPSSLILPSAIFIIAVSLYGYATHLNRKGVLA